MGYRLISIVIMAAFYGCYVAKLLCQRRQGIQTDQLGRGKTGFVRLVEITVKATAVLAFAADAFSVLVGECPFPAAVRVLGAVTGAAGTLLFIAAVRTMGSNWRAGVPQADRTQLVTGGVYQISRNPAFLGFDLLHIGILLMFFSWPLCILTALALLMFHLQIVKVEEEFLLAAFGDDYRQYQQRVCRYLGRRG